MSAKDAAHGPSEVTVRHDGRRQAPGEGRSEVWHFDASLNNGMTLAIGFCLVGVDSSDPDLFETVVNLMLTTIDGHSETHAVAGTVRASDIGSTTCVLPFGPNTAEGDLRAYTLHVETADEAVSLDLRYEAQTEAYQPRIASPVTLGGESQVHFADLILPHCTVTGTVSIRGVTSQVAGEGAHDHQWFNSNPLTTWHHWLWGHVSTKNYSVILFDLVASKDHHLERIPLFGVFDASGHLTFDNKDSAIVHADLALEPASGKQYPRRSIYRFTDDDRTFELRFEQTATLLSENMYTTSQSPAGSSDSAQQSQFDDLGIRPSYGRFRADATLTVTDRNGSVQEHGPMIYEFNYPATSDPGALTSIP